MICLRWLLFIVVLLIGAGLGHAEGLHTEMIKIPIEMWNNHAEVAQLEAMIVRPDDDAPHPLAIINHGTAAYLGDGKDLTPKAMWGPARVFARRGWVVLVLMRQGYGDSEGTLADKVYSCAQPNYMKVADDSADDIAAAAKYMRAKPYVRKDKWIVIGVSAGGFATVALSARMPQGLAAAIAFAPGHGSMGPDTPVCREDLVTNAFRYFGTLSRVPLLWIAAENDRLFGPRVVKEWTEAFSKSGGHLTFVPVGPFGDEGHALFGAPDGLPVWTPIVDRFLAVNKLTLRETLIDVPRPNVAPPASLNARGRDAFNTYLDAGPDKAFAVAPNGGWAWTQGYAAPEFARRTALEACQKRTASPCKIANVNDQPAD
jgi:dienelactone hydrolase